jgi:hypothetical protein|nr:MAG TPA: hypothetical protein [Caudoviricetes sp.]
MQKNVIQELIKEANKSPTLEYSDNILVFKDNVKDTIKAVKRRLGILQTLEMEIDYELTVNHVDDE